MSTSSFSTQQLDDYRIRSETLVHKKSQVFLAQLADSPKLKKISKEEILPAFGVVFCSHAAFRLFTLYWNPAAPEKVD